MLPAQGPLMVIRAATAEDYPAVKRLLAANKLPLDGVDEVSRMLVAVQAGQIAGAAAIESYSDGALLRSVVVAESAQGRGLGTQLSVAALNAAADGGAPVVFLLTTTAESFFARLGFQQARRDDVPASIARSIEFVSACPASAVVMRKGTAAVR